jgi:hypothetical protein
MTAPFTIIEDMMYRKDESLNLVVLGNSHKAGKIIFLITIALFMCVTRRSENVPT